MPTYQYACTACDHRFEGGLASSDAARPAGPRGAPKLRKVFSSVGIVFKGSGFYRTDSRAGAVNGGGSSDSKTSESKSETGSGASSDSGASSGSGSSSGSSSSGSGSSGSGSSSGAASTSTSSPAAASS